MDERRQYCCLEILSNFRRIKDDDQGKERKLVVQPKSRIARDP